MGWLSRLFHRGGPKRRPASPRPTFRPQLEALEDRWVPNVSSVIDAAGSRTVFAVYANGDLYRFDQTSVQRLGGNVLRAHGYRNFDGTVGLIVVFDDRQNLRAFDFNSRGTQLLGEGIVDAAKAYDKDGHLRLYVTYVQGRGFNTFVTIEYTDTSVRVVPQDGFVAILIHPFQDQRGNIGLEVSYFDSTSTNTLVEIDSFGARFLARNAVADKTVAPDGVHFVLDVTYFSGMAFEYSNTYAIFLGDNISS